MRHQLAPSLIFYAVATARGLIQPYLGVALYFVIGVFLLLQVHTAQRRLRRNRS